MILEFLLMIFGVALSIVLIFLGSLIVSGLEAAQDKRIKDLNEKIKQLEDKK